MGGITKEEREFWDTHDTSDMDLEPVDVVFVRRTPMTNVSIRIPQSDLEKIKEIAKKRGIPYTVLMRNMIKRELKILSSSESSGR